MHTYSCVLLLIAALAAPPVTAQSARAVADSLGQALTDGRPWGAVIGVVDGDRQAVYGFGAADSSGATPTARTMFEIGSVTKTFTGLLLADRIECGLVRPSDPVQAYLPDSLSVPTYEGRPVTLVHLATHRSGLPRLPTNLLALAHPDDPYADYTLEALYAFLDGYRLDRAPGTAYAYSNLGMGLLGHLLARQADTTLAALIQQRIADPLGLPDTRITLTPDQAARFAQGHSEAGSPVPPWHIPTLGAAGALRSTAADLLAYLRAHLTATDDAPLGRAMRRAIAPRDSTGLADTRIGLGWHVSTRGGHTVVWHNGGTGGFSSFIGFDPSTGRGVVVLANASIGQAVTRAGFELMDVLVATESAFPTDPDSS